MPAHYALSDAAIVLVALWAAPALWQRRQVLPAIAIACFGTAAAIGVVRFAAGLQAELAALHASGSQTLGLVALLALAVTGVGGGDRHAKVVSFASLALAISIYLFDPTFVGPLSLLAFAVALAAGLARAIRFGASWFAPAGFLLLLVDTVAIRRAAWLSEAAAWHAYHLLIALALLALTKGALSGAPPEVKV